MASSRYRLAVPGDIDAILPMMREYYLEDGYPLVEAAAREALLALIRDERLGRLWVAHDGARLVGYLAVTLGYSLEYGGRDAFIDEIYMARGSRGQGLGREAMSLAESYCREAGPLCQDSCRPDRL